MTAGKARPKAKEKGSAGGRWGPREQRPTPDKKTLETEHEKGGQESPITRCRGKEKTGRLTTNNTTMDGKGR